MNRETSLPISFVCNSVPLSSLNVFIFFFSMPPVSQKSWSIKRVWNKIQPVALASFSIRLPLWQNDTLPHGLRSHAHTHTHTAEMYCLDDVSMSKNIMNADFRPIKRRALTQSERDRQSINTNQTFLTFLQPVCMTQCLRLTRVPRYK